MKLSHQELCKPVGFITCCEIRTRGFQHTRRMVRVRTTNIKCWEAFPEITQTGRQFQKGYCWPQLVHDQLLAVERVKARAVLVGGGCWKASLSLSHCFGVSYWTGVFTEHNMLCVRVVCPVRLFVWLLLVYPWFLCPNRKIRCWKVFYYIGSDVRVDSVYALTVLLFNRSNMTYPEWFSYFLSVWRVRTRHFWRSYGCSCFSERHVKYDHRLFLQVSCCFLLAPLFVFPPQLVYCCWWDT